MNHRAQSISEARRRIRVDEIVERYRANLLRLGEALQADVERARGALTSMSGSITVERRSDGIYAMLENTTGGHVTGRRRADGFGCGDPHPT